MDRGTTLAEEDKGLKTTHGIQGGDGGGSSRQVRRQRCREGKAKHCGKREINAINDIVICGQGEIRQGRRQE